MVQNVVRCAYTETYDLNTSIGELSILGIHTPQSPTLHRIFKGFFENYRKFKVLGCNFRMVCASQQALTPDLIGLEAGQVDPRDVLNPILFRACTGEHYNALVDEAYNYLKKVGGSGTTKNSSVDQILDTRQSAIDAYYALLSDNDWRKEHPQHGLTVTGLKPFVHNVVTTRPFNNARYSGNGDFADADTPYARGTVVNGFGNNTPSPDSNTTVNSIPTVFMSDGVTEMPWMETATIAPMADANEEPLVSQTIAITHIPRTYVGMVVLPPAILQRLFFRLRIVWFIEFKDFRPAYEIGPIEGQFMTPEEYEKQGISESNTAYTYFNMYHTASKLDKDYSSFDVVGMDSVTEVNASGQ